MIELRSLVEVALRRFGCQLEAIEENLLHAAIPIDSPMRQILDVDDTAYLALVAIEEDRLAGLEPVRYLVPGSIYRERFIGILTEHGSVGDTMLPSVYACPDDLSVCSFLIEAIRDTSDCGIQRSKNVVHRCVTFHFVVDLFAIEANKTLVSVTFDFDNKRLISNPDISRLQIAEPAIVEIADTELKVAATTVLENVRTEACRQIESYADEHSNERTSARNRLKRLARKQLDDADAQPTHTRDEPVEDQRDEIARDWDQRIRHADSHYKAEGAQITLVSATRHLRPFVRYEIQFPDRTMADDTWKVLYDLTCGGFLLPDCKSCGSTVERLVIGEGLCPHPLCDGCANTTPACRHRTCKLCMRKCCLCAATMCGNCSFECSHDGCSLSFCEKHKKPCSKCEGCVCGRHRQFCRRCQRTLCNRCYHDHQWKQADCGHLLDCGLQGRVCRVCKNAVCTICSGRCEHCARFACNRHIVNCLSCRSGVCERCAGLDCRMCGAKCCKDHSFLCKVCTQYFCYEHTQWCAVCNRMLCDRDVISCRSCHSFLCARHSRKSITELGDLIRCVICDEESETSLVSCTRCQRRVPARLLMRNNGIDELFCIECRSKCSRCRASLLELEIGQCDTCGVLLCDDCLEIHADVCVSRLERVGGFTQSRSLTA